MSFVDTCLSRAEVIAVMTAIHMTSMPSNAVVRNELLASATVDLRPSRSALFHKKIFLKVGLARCSLCDVSNDTMSDWWCYTV